MPSTEVMLQPAQKRVVQWLVGGGHPATPESVVAYYDRRGRAQSDAAQMGRLGAAKKMLAELYLAGAVRDGRVTTEGKRAAQ